jgi:hypothetical protein
LSFSEVDIKERIHGNRISSERNFRKKSKFFCRMRNGKKRSLHKSCFKQSPREGNDDSVALVLYSQLNKARITHRCAGKLAAWEKISQTYGKKTGCIINYLLTALLRY